jgi:hypothetical protein
MPILSRKSWNRKIPPSEEISPPLKLNLTDFLKLNELFGIIIACAPFWDDCGFVTTNYTKKSAFLQLFFNKEKAYK